MKTNCLQVQLLLQSATIPANDNIRFKNILTQDGITYDPDTGIIQLGAAGIYHIDYSIMATQFSPAVNLSLVSSQGDQIPSNPIYPDGLIANAALIDAKTSGVTLSLKNGAQPIGDPNPVSIMANLVVYAVDTSDTNSASGAYGVFVGFNTDTYHSSAEGIPVILPVTHAATAVPEAAFNLNKTGTVIVNQAGVYQINCRIQHASIGAGNTLAIQVNGMGGNALNDNTIFVQAADNYSMHGDITTIFTLKAGDEVSAALLKGNGIELIATNNFFIGMEGVTDIISPTVAIVLHKIA